MSNTNHDTEAVRAEFEHWFSDGGEYPLACQRAKDGGYMLAQAESSWTAWRAATSKSQERIRELTEAARDVLAERARQVNSEGWTPEHDDQYESNQLARAAYCYVGHYYKRGWTAPEVYAAEEVPFDWPWAEKWWKPKTPRRDLVRAAALLLAEIERMDRAALKEPK